ncbi:MAG: hypothetical protein HZA50_01770 [Planctomycetes bacterium]|nr:hypothetical protein [Planctomycetota bacterium]
MPKWLEITLLILLPLAWGLGVEAIFEFIRYRRARGVRRAGKSEVGDDRSV